MKKTFIPNSVLFFTTVYLAVIAWGLVTADNKIGVTFYAVVLALFFISIIYKRDPFASILSIEDYRLKVNYFFPGKQTIEIDLYKVQSDVIVKRYYAGHFAGGFPGLLEYLNYKWYFTSEKYELEFMYDGEYKVIPVQVNLLGFRRFLESFVQSVNAVNRSQMKSLQSDFGKLDLAVELSELVIRHLIF